jgi:hypothetical protein
MNNKTTVYRIQDAQGRGLFKPGMSEKWLDKDRTFLPEAPVKELMRISRQAGSEFHLAFACLSLEDLRKWVSKTEYARLQKLCYYACSLEVEKFHPLEYQVIAGRKRPYRKGAKLINLYPETE